MKAIILAAAALMGSASASAELLTNVYGRDYTLLNGRWEAIPDLYDQGERMKLYENRRPEGKTDFYEYSFDGALRLDVPGDWNSQNPELKYYEGSVWYHRPFTHTPEPGRRTILYFGAASYRAKAYLNGTLVAEHEGGFTPFQADVTEQLKPGENTLIVEVNNRRSVDAIPALAFDWWNYGGITRDVMLVSVPDNHIADYFVQLDKNRPDVINIDLRMSRPEAGVPVSVAIPELRRTFEGVTDAEGRVRGTIQSKAIRRWAPGEPYLYDVELRGADDVVREQIGFRNIAVDGTRILINGRPQFMRSVSFHEEIPQRMGRAFSEADARMLLGEAADLGVNMVRLAHYPQNENTVRMAEKMGIVLWQEIPIWQGIDFTDDSTRVKAQRMFAEMQARDKNRCAVGFWGVANETRPSEARNAFLGELLDKARATDSTRLYVAAFDNVYYRPEHGAFTMDDDFADRLDVVAVNKYMGWYAPWPVDPADAHWRVATDKPLIISEFGGEALFGRHGDDDVVSSWSEDYQARLYRDNLRMFENIPNLAGVSPWVLFDFRSPFRFHPANQEGWNRKGLVSDRGERKRAWHIMHDFYEKKRSETK